MARSWGGMVMMALCGVVMTSLLTATMVLGNAEFRYTVAEEVDIGTVVADIAKDIGVTSSTDTQLSLLRKSKVPLAINGGLLVTSERVDREALCGQREICVDEMTVVVRRPGPNPPQFVRVAVTVVDVNDHAPTFTPSDVRLDVKESEMPGYRLVLPRATDGDSARFGVQRYVLAAASDTFKLDTGGRDGEPALVLLKALDRERETSLTVNVDALDSGDPHKSGRLYVRISIVDVNDHYPEFDKDKYETSIGENSALPAPLLRVHATDRDHDDNGKVFYALAPASESDYGDYFLVSNTTGEVFLRRALDYEVQSEYELSVIAKDLASVDTKTSTVQVVVRVLDENDNAPQISVMNIDSAADLSVFEVLEEQERNSFVAFVEVSDPDTGTGGQVDCSLGDRKFSLQKVTGGYNLFTALKLDRERTSSLTVDITCADRGQVPKAASRKIDIIVKDINDNVPAFPRQKYTGELLERTFIGANVLRVTANDSDAGANAAIEYSLSSTGSLYFDIDPQFGIITLKTEVDREKISHVHFFVYARDGGQPSMTGSASINITITDVNDEKPHFLQNSYQFEVEEHGRESAIVGEVKAYDTDSPPFNRFVYSLQPIGGSTNTFDINPHSGLITTRRSLDREQQAVYYVNVLATDSGDSALQSTASVTIFVGDINDNAPAFVFPTSINRTVHISPLTRVGSTIAEIYAKDSDDGSNGTVSYAIGASSHEGVFSLDPRSGRLSLNVDMRSMGAERVMLRLIASDHGVPSYVSVSNLTVIVNHSLILQPVDNEELLFFGLTLDHLKVIFVLGSIFLLVIIVLVCAIVCVRRQEDRRRGHKYNCRTEAMRHHTPLSPGNGGETESLYPLSHGANMTPEKHLMVSVNEGSRSPVSHVLYGSLTPPYDGFMANPAVMMAPAHRHQLHPQEARHHAAMHAAGEDGDSLEGSNADSGRGTSEDGDMAARLAAAAAEARRGSRDCAPAAPPTYASLRQNSGTPQSLLACHIPPAMAPLPDPRSPTKARPMTPASGPYARPPSRGVGGGDGTSKRQPSVGDLYSPHHHGAASPSGSECACYHPSPYGDNFVIDGQQGRGSSSFGTQYTQSLIPSTLPANSYHSGANNSPLSFVDYRQPIGGQGHASTAMPMVTMPVYSHATPSLSTGNGGPWTRRQAQPGQGQGQSWGRPLPVPEEEVLSRSVNSVSGPIDPKQLCDEIDELFFSKQ